jgi:radical SAM superfamily enzyme YgiQ (UPF0313 family)
MKLLLINPSAAHWRVRPGERPRLATRMFRFSMLSSLSVAAAAPPGVEVRIVDEEVEPLDLATEADLVGISFMTFNAPRAYALANRLRQEFGKTVIFGGYHPTLCPDEAKAHADAVCVGEAEPVLPAIIRDCQQGRLQPFYRAGLADLRGLPAPNRSLIRRSAYAMAEAVQATRGCPHGCTFCSISAFHRQQFRMRPVEEVLAELRGLGRQLVFMDDNLVAHREYAAELFSGMIPLRKRWVSQCSVTIGEDPSLMDLAARSGCRGLFLGLESLSQEGLKHWNKRFNRAADYARIIARLHARGIAVIAGIVLGHDWDTPWVFARMLQFLDEARMDALQATILTPFPGTPLFHEMNKQGRLTDRDWSHYDFAHVVFEPAQMSAETLAGGHRWLLQQFYSRRRVARRLLASLGYLAPSTLLCASAPLNLSYRSRLRSAGILEPAQAMPTSQVLGQGHRSLGRRSQAAASAMKAADGRVQGSGFRGWSRPKETKERKGVEPGFFTVSNQGDTDRR